MKVSINEYIITDEPTAVDFDTVAKLLSKTYWAEHRTEETIRKSIEHSVCFSLFHEEQQIGFARVVTDFSTFGYLADVIIQDEHRGKGLGKWFVETIVNDSRWRNLFLMLGTLDAHGLYEKYGFKTSERLMGRSPHL